MNVSFIGLGVMGFPMSAHLINKNNNLNIKVYNRSIEKSQNWVSKFNGFISTTPAEAAKDCDIVFMCVGNDKDVDQVVRGEKGILSSIPENSIIVDHTTASATIATDLYDFCKKTKNVSFKINSKMLEFYSSRNIWESENGDFELFIGTNSNTRRKESFELKSLN